MSDRRKFVKNLVLLTAANIGYTAVQGFPYAQSAAESDKIKFRRIRPGDPDWPSESEWNTLSDIVNADLIKLDSPFKAAMENPAGAEALYKELKNPYFIGDQPALTQTIGWLNAWTSAPSVYAVAAKNTNDIVAAVNFATEKKLRLVVKGGGHSYNGTSNCADSLLIWTRAMNNIAMHDQFIPTGCQNKLTPVPAVTVEAGAIWMQVYNEVTTKAGRYVQGGGCATVGVAGLIQSGGFGSFSKKFGLAASGLLEAEIVIANGEILKVNEYNYPDLFWALKGGGGGSFGVISRLTLKTRDLPGFFGVANATIKAVSDQAYTRLIEAIVNQYNDYLFNEHWGEQIRFYQNNTVRIAMVFQGLSSDQAKEAWKNFQLWVDSNATDYQWTSPMNIIAVPSKYLWDPSFLNKYAPHAIEKDDRLNAPPQNIYWAGDKEESGQFLYGYHSQWIPQDLLQQNNKEKLVFALFNASRYWTVSLHFNKGLAGAPGSEINAAKNTAMNPMVLDAFALAIIAGGSQPAYPGITGHEPDLIEGKQSAEKMRLASKEISKLVSDTASYVSESDFFEHNWQQSFWGANYNRLLAVKKKYDPDGLFYVHHGVGTEDWSNDGFTKLA